MGWLQDNCPRLASALHEQAQVLAARNERRRRKQDQVLQLEALVAHRELQHVRAGTQRGRKGQSYIHQRQRKLAQAEQALQHVRQDLATVDKWEPIP